MGTEGARAQIGTQHESQVLERCLDGLHCEAGCRAHFLKVTCSLAAYTLVLLGVGSHRQLLVPLSTYWQCRSVWEEEEQT